MATDLKDLKITITTKVSVKATKAGDMDDAKFNPEMSISETLLFGTGDGQANMFFSDRRTLAFGVTDTLDLYGVLSSPLSPTISFSKVKGIFVWNRSGEIDIHDDHAVATTPQLTVGGVAAAEMQGPFDTAGDAIKVEAGEHFIATYKNTGWACAGGADILDVVNNDGAEQALYDILIWGLSA